MECIKLIKGGKFKMRHKRHLEFIPLCKSSNPNFMEHWKNICMEADKKEEQWVNKLRADGVSASHPNDGWINRKDNELILIYPEFNDGVKIGSIVALGDPDKYKLVKIIDHRKGIIGDINYWKFEEHKLEDK